MRSRNQVESQNQVEFGRENKVRLKRKQVVKKLRIDEDDSPKLGIDEVGN